MGSYYIVGNFGNHSLAVIRYLTSQGIPDLHFLYVDTGFASSIWSQHREQAHAYAESLGIQVHRLQSLKRFDELVEDRRQFPSSKFQWCASFLKGLTLIAALDELDPDCRGTIVSGKRQLDSLRYAALQEFETDSEFYQGRTVWHPLQSVDAEGFKELVLATGFAWQERPSQECSPCIHTPETQLPFLPPDDIQRLHGLEEKLNQTLFPRPIQDYQTLQAQPSAVHPTNFDLGCGSPWNCGE